LFAPGDASRRSARIEGHERPATPILELAGEAVALALVAVGLDRSNDYLPAAPIVSAHSLVIPDTQANGTTIGETPGIAQSLPGMLQSSIHCLATCGQPGDRYQRCQADFSVGTFPVFSSINLWSCAWVRRKQVRVGGNSVAKSVACAPRSAIANRPLALASRRRALASRRQASASRQNWPQPTVCDGISPARYLVARLLSAQQGHACCLQVDFNLAVPRALSVSLTC